ncbi:MAG: prepilin-type N-terminal cleavage/methylation domain-containing protein [Chroococcidiopsidaceae cyanobacterium CP_BM_RX_35]|nr:prepilin-type N-terminal cleavage/methylation domain-containing protein [Chroococcidiopsidaceae cyanobacterium CP_BM_RX_35]
MIKRSSRLLLNYLYGSYRKQEKGFTLLELLSAMVISGIVLSSTLTFIVNLLQFEQRNFAEDDLQQRMQTTLNSLSKELREAVYVYDGRCLQSGGQPGSCPNLANYIPTPANSVPTLAFWKVQSLPQSIQAQCISANPPLGVNCISLRSYSLIVYYLQKNQPTDTPQWHGPARITRYQLTQFDSNSNTIAGYVDPTAQGTSFQTWPIGTGQVLPSHLSGTPDTVVDSVDLTTAQTLNCSTLYAASPVKGFTSFYACVRTSARLGTIQDVRLFLTGNASEKPGTNNNFRPTLLTDVTVGGIFNRVP